MRGPRQGQNLQLWRLQTLSYRPGAEHTSGTPRLETEVKNLEEFLIDSAATSHCCIIEDNFKESVASLLVDDKDCTSIVLGVDDIDFVIKDVTGWKRNWAPLRTGMRS
ncbi:hypothetical protein CEXT_450951 [Caerostris extrusa]|uniref:Uncharacterized protein n=1 Tax=Caerostris extrusa TaxID=172846 RepID=A0AAV4QJI4_CAEEX|nr:hypothetical protein CEXT_450951 [Caerostris extrusa]